MSEVAQKSQASEPTDSQRSASEAQRATPLRPAANILENRRGVILLVEMPGVSKIACSCTATARTWW